MEECLNQPGNKIWIEYQTFITITWRFEINSLFSSLFSVYFTLATIDHHAPYAHRSLHFFSLIPIVKNVRIILFVWGNHLVSDVLRNVCWFFSSEEMIPLKWFTMTGQFWYAICEKRHGFFSKKKYFFEVERQVIIFSAPFWVITNPGVDFSKKERNVQKNTTIFFLKKRIKLKKMKNSLETICDSIE